MNDKDKSPRTQLVAKIKSVGNILITVSRDPSVDQLTAALGLTFMLDKMGKHATAVFSGAIPPAINFLEPEKIFENNADSLRDFIISLDKAKADRLRYKVEGDLVKVFITPYKTKISSDDLKFEEGDFNVELVITIGVDKKDHLDAAIAAHGRILHDATTATINISSERDGGLGTISWQDSAASSLSELVADLAMELESKDKPLVDEQIATALLTGVVAATDQFRNDKTSPAAMTLAANLMAKGANQQLIASELAAAEEEELLPDKIDLSQSIASETAPIDDEMKIDRDETGTIMSSDTNSAESGESSEEKKETNKTPDDENGGNSDAEDKTPEVGSEIPELADRTEIVKKESPTSESIAAPVADNSSPNRFAEQRSADALAAAEAQLTAAEQNAKPAVAAEMPETAGAETETETETELDKVVAQNSGADALADLRAAAENVAFSSAVATESQSALSHGTPYIEEQPVAAPSGSTMIGDALPPIPEPAPIVTIPPMNIPSPAPELPAVPPDLINLSPTAPTEQSQPIATPPLPNLDLPLPPPPLPPAPEVGQLPPLPPSPIAPPAIPMTSSSPNPSIPPMPSDLPTVEPANSMFPSVDTNSNPDDPTQYQIPSSQ